MNRIIEDQKFIVGIEFAVRGSSTRGKWLPLQAEEWRLFPSPAVRSPSAAGVGS